MKKIKSLALLVCGALIFSACGTKMSDVNPTAGLIGHSTDF